ncbi:hypothetical protein FPV58_28775 [Mycolicibacterium porcinum]|nr:hypothetical protein FPV58_28775 [Mycolicibacterium porcinum]
MKEVDRRARHEAVRLHHPDIGGSAEALIAALAACDRGAPRPAIQIRRTCRGRLAAYLTRRRRNRRANRSKKAQR